MSRRRVWIAGAIIVALLSALLGAVLHRILDFTRGTALHSLSALQPHEQPPAVADPQFVHVISHVAAAPLVAARDVEILVSPGASFGRLFADLRAASRSITFQSYYCRPGLLADSTVAILAERARAGVRVLFLADGYDCRQFVRRYRAELRTAGVDLAVLRPVHWYELHRAQHRSHVRIVVIDGAIAYTGGFGIDDKWADGPGRRGWRETNVRFTGSAVHQAQGAFLVGWAEATRQLVAGPHLFALDTTGLRPPDTTQLRALDTTSLRAPHDAAGATLAGSAPGPAAPPGGADAPLLASLQFAGPGLGTSAFERMLFLTISGARERLLITNPYFVPTTPLRRLLIDAAARGVDVRVLTAGARSDVPSTTFAGRGYYGELLRGGVRLYEYAPTMVHAKTLVADGVWAVIGSMNFDNRSIRLNDEANLLVYDRTLGSEMERIFADDLQQSIEITAQSYAERPLRQRLLEWAAKQIAPLL